jgi:hypothetical protein
MRLSLTVVALIVGLPAIAQADAAADVVKIFGRDPGTGPAYACFVRHYTKAHLASHPDQNVTDMLLYVSKQEGADPYYGLNMQVNFRQLNKPFHVSGSCGMSTEGKSALACGVECDGGQLSVRVKSDISLLVEIPESVRLYDPSDTEAEPGAELPEKARFGTDDKLFRLDRTVLKDCLPVIYDEETKAKVSQGITTQ